MTTDRFVHVPYLVKAGDTLSEIAFRFLGRVDRCMELAKLNEIQYPGTIQAGATIMIPVLLTPNLMAHPAVVEALKPHREEYPVSAMHARGIFNHVSSSYQPVWDRDVDIVTHARCEGAIALAQALGILDDIEAQEALDANDKAFQG